MDIDEPHSKHISDYGHYADGPAKKRLHSDISAPLKPFRPGHAAPTLQYGPSTPFIFALPADLRIPPDPPAPSTTSSFPTFSATSWSAQNLGFGGVKPMGSSFTEDVEMKEESHAGPRKEDVPEKQTRELREGTDSSGENGTHMDTASQNSKGESSTGANTRPISRSGPARVRKSRLRSLRRARVESESEGEEAHDSAILPRRDRGNLKTEHTYNLNMNSPIMRHSEIPALLLGYLQFFVNASIVIFVLYLAVQFVLTIRRDVKDKMAEASVEILQEIAECTQLYLANRCDPVMRVPAMDAPCRAWDACMHRDPTVVGRTNVMAETFAGVINSFVDPISWKTMGFTLVTLTFLIILTNSALFNLRHRATAEPLPTPPHMFPHLHNQPWMQHPQHGFPGHMLAAASAHPPAYGVDSTHGAAMGQIGWEGDKGKKKGWLW